MIKLNNKKIEKIITKMLKGYKRSRLVFGISNNPIIIRDCLKYSDNCYYHFYLDDNEIHTSFWNNYKNEFTRKIIKLKR